MKNTSGGFTYLIGCNNLSIITCNSIMQMCSVTILEFVLVCVLLQFIIIIANILSVNVVCIIVYCHIMNERKNIKLLYSKL